MTQENLGYLVNKEKIQCPQYISKPSGIINPLPVHCDIEELINDVDNISPFDEYRKTVTFEPMPRHIPFIFNLKDEPKMVFATTLFREMYSKLYQIIKRKFFVDVITFERRSRLGGPFYDYFPERGEKVKKIEEWWLENTQNNILSDANIILQRRLQPEPLDKEREFFFISNDGQIEKKKVGKDYRKVPNKDLYGSRVRLVFNYPVENLITQVFDTLWHDAIMRFPCFHHQMATNPPKLLNYALFGDVRHFERHIGCAVFERSKQLKGGYQILADHCLNSSFLVPTPDFKGAYIIKPDHKTDNYVQFGSGHSSVAPIAKEYMWMVFSLAKLALSLNCDMNNALNYCDSQLINDKLVDVALQMNDPLFFDYGDDFIITSSNKDNLIKLFSLLNEVLTCNLEEPAKFLGWEYKQQDDKFYLSERSYINNFYRPERRPYSNFRPYYCFGREERIHNYEVSGTHNMHLLIEKETQVFYKYVDERSFKDIVRKEKELVQSLPQNYILGKDYMLTRQEKEKLDLVDKMNPDIVNDIILFLQPDLLKGKFYARDN